MKQTFSTKWKASIQPRKQRKYNYNAPLHIKRKMMSATLEKTLRKKYGLRSLEIRKGDEVIIMRGKNRKKKGKIVDVQFQNLRVAIENIQRTKKDGNKINIWFRPSCLKIIALNLDDKKRLKRINKETKSEKKEENVQEKK